jgi:hypothetical protein
MRRLMILAVALTMASGTARAAGEEGVGAAGVQVSGFVDASYGGNLDLGTDGFGLDQVELDLLRDLGGQGGLRADLEWVKQGEEWALAVEQGYLDYLPPFAPALTFTLGKFNAPIGFELLDAPDMFQYSHALVFTYGLPVNLTGAMLAGALGERLDLRAYLVNGWDDNDLGQAGPKTVGGRLGLSFGEHGGAGLAAISGSAVADSLAFDRRVVDVDLNLTPLPALRLGGELNLGRVEVAGEESTWTGFLAMVHYDLNAWLGLTARYDWLDDPDGWLFGLADGETRTAIAIAPTFVLGEGMGALVELRIDGSSEDVFTDADGEAKASTTSLAFEMTYRF